jgi:hypothetical protein
MVSINRVSLRAGLAGVVAAQDPTLATRVGEDDDGALDLIATAAALAEEAQGFLVAAVVSARNADVAWARIGAELGVSRQAVQQRFTAAMTRDWAEYASEVERPPDAWRLSPVTVYTEMEELENLGRQGWHSVDLGPGFHDVVPSPVKWLHQRVTVFDPQPAKGDGWLRIGMAFPFVYYTKETAEQADPAD